MAANQEDFVRIGLRATTSSDDTPTHCTICLNEQQPGQDVDEIRRCGHTFHKHCLLAWLNSPNTQHSSCPNCRQELFPTRHPLPVSSVNKNNPRAFANHNDAATPRRCRWRVRSSDLGLKLRRAECPRGNARGYGGFFSQPRRPSRERAKAPQPRCSWAIIVRPPIPTRLEGHSRVGADARMYHAPPGNR